MQKEILTKKETEELLSISPQTCRNWVKDGTLKPYGLGRRVYFKYSEIIEAHFSSPRESRLSA
jgi:predicted site-specific integrase-resolvase